MAWNALSVGFGAISKIQGLYELLIFVLSKTAPVVSCA